MQLDGFRPQQIAAAEMKIERAYKIKADYLELIICLYLFLFLFGGMVLILKVKQVV